MLKRSEVKGGTTTLLTAIRATVLMAAVVSMVVLVSSKIHGEVPLTLIEATAIFAASFLIISHADYRARVTSAVLEGTDGAALPIVSGTTRGAIKQRALRHLLLLMLLST